MFEKLAIIAVLASLLGPLAELPPGWDVQEAKMREAMLGSPDPHIRPVPSVSRSPSTTSEAMLGSSDLPPSTMSEAMLGRPDPHARSTLSVSLPPSSVSSADLPPSEVSTAANLK